MAECWLAQFAPAGAEECRGLLQRCHLVTKRRLKELWKEAHEPKAQMRPHPGGWLHALPKTLQQLLEDERLWRLGCERHHRLMDERLSLLVPREEIPEPAEMFCLRVGLDWWLDQTYGMPVIV